MIVLGIDPGASGGLVLLEAADPCPAVLDAIALDDLGPSWWAPGPMEDTIRRLPRRPDRIALEAAQAPRTGSGRVGRGGHKIGMRWGYLHAVCALTWPGALLWTPAASSWTAILRDQPGQGKARAVALCSTRLPGLDLTPGRRRKPHDGLADAGALALWALGRRP
jgi:hypothetical protein